MATAGRGVALESLGRLFGRGTVAALGEGALLERFTADGDEDAFEALVTRHGPMVLGVCRRGLVDPHDVEDAFQATFLVLVRKAGSLRDADHLGPWLFGVARKVTARARTRSARRRDRERPGSENAALAVCEPESHALDRRELRSVLDEEIGRLPEKYRAPVVLCYLEGLTHEEAAGRLRCPVGTVRSRMSWARERLRVRLDRRGLAPTGLVVGPVLASPFAPPVPHALAVSTLAAAARASAGTLSTTTAAGAAALAKGVTTTMLLKKVSLAASTLAVTALLAGGAALSGAHPGDQPGSDVARADSRPGAADGGPPDAGKVDRPRPEGLPPDTFKSEIKRRDETPKVAPLRDPRDTFGPASIAEVRALRDQNEALHADLRALMTQVGQLRQQLDEIQQKVGKPTPPAMTTRGLTPDMLPPIPGQPGNPQSQPGAPLALPGVAQGNSLPLAPVTPPAASVGVAVLEPIPSPLAPATPAPDGLEPAVAPPPTGHAPDPASAKPAAPATSSIPTTLETGGLVMVVSAEGDRILAKSKHSFGVGGGVMAGAMGGMGPPAKPGFHLYRAPRGVKVAPIVNNNLLALVAKGPTIPEIVVFNALTGTWSVRTLDPTASGRVAPSLGPEMASYTIGQRVYAYSTRAHRWDRADFKGKPIAVGETPFGPGFKDGTTLYAFDVMTGTFKKVDFESLAAEADRAATPLRADEKRLNR